MTIDLNADMGESFGPWVMGRDAELMDVVTSANIACGFHAGDPDVMAQTMATAVEKGVGIGAHPGFPDIQGFGRHRREMPETTLANMVRYQVGAASAMATAAGGSLRHLKLHGALANMCAEDGAMARLCFDAALSVAPDLVVMVIAETEQQRAAEALGCTWAVEVLADRGYNDDATLVDRRLPGAMIRDPGEAARRMVEMMREGAIVTASGKRIRTRIDTICCHGDTPEAVEIARAVRRGLEAEGIALARL